jgi:hypothetical protein
MTQGTETAMSVTAAVKTFGAVAVLSLWSAAFGSYAVVSYRRSTRTV